MPVGHKRRLARSKLAGEACVLLTQRRHVSGVTDTVLQLIVSHEVQWTFSAASSRVAGEILLNVARAVGSHVEEHRRARSRLKLEIRGSDPSARDLCCFYRRRVPLQRFEHALRVDERSLQLVPASQRLPQDSRVVSLAASSLELTLFTGHKVSNATDDGLLRCSYLLRSSRLALKFYVLLEQSHFNLC